MLIASFALIPAGFIGFEFMTQTDRGEFAIQIDLEPGTPIEKTNLISERIENVVGKYPEVRIFYECRSSSEGLIGFSSANSTEIDVVLVLKYEIAHNRRYKQFDQSQIQRIRALRCV